MKSFLKYGAIGIGLLIALFTLGRVTGLIQYYAATTPSNQPTIKINNYLIGSSLIAPKRFDFVFYRSKINNSPFVHRVCGIAGDKIQLINGELFVNDKSTKDRFSVQYEYIIHSDNFDDLKTQLGLTDSDYGLIGGDSAIIFSNEKTLKENNINGRRRIENSSIQYSAEAMKYFNPNWSIDNFGPVTVPDDAYFLMGDNRHNALDSRYMGFYTSHDITGVVINK